MSYKRKLFNDKTIVAAAAVGVLAVSAIVGGVMLNDAGDSGKNGNSIVELDGGNNGSLSAELETTTDSEKMVSDDENIVAENLGNENTEPQSEAAEDSTDSSLEGDINNTSDNNESDIEASEEQTTGHNMSGDTENVNADTGIVGLNFSPSSTLVWPVEGNVIIDFDMKNTVYFATLDLYKCSDAVCIQSAVDTPVYAGCGCSVESIDYDSEIGNNVTVSMGSGYMLTYGQLKDVQIQEGQVLEEGDLIGYVGNPTKYYSVEGSHLYMKMTQNGEAIDPLDYLNYE